MTTSIKLVEIIKDRLTEISAIFVKNDICICTTYGGMGIIGSREYTTKTKIKNLFCLDDLIIAAVMQHQQGLVRLDVQLVIVFDLMFPYRRYMILHHSNTTQQHNILGSYQYTSLK